MADAYIIDAVRTPRGGGKPGKGALSHLHPQHLAATVLKAIAERSDRGLDQPDWCACADRTPYLAGYRHRA